MVDADMRLQKIKAIGEGDEILRKKFPIVTGLPINCGILEEYIPF